ncbi:MAG TPA: flagellar biosynthetic protein FliO [Mobilitalea sp.]|nr:flagellar biosynthetic protein FliO [Mobilitalea sp.]
MFTKTIVILTESNILDQINNPTQATTNTGFSTSDNFMELIGLVFLLIIILAAAYYTTRFVGGVKMGQLKNSNFQVIDTYRIGPNKMMQIVKVGNKYILVAIGKDSVNFITELEESEVHIREFHTVDKQSFKQIFDKIRNNKG